MPFDQAKSLEVEILEVFSANSQYITMKWMCNPRPCVLSFNPLSTMHPHTKFWGKALVDVNRLPVGEEAQRTALQFFVCLRNSTLSVCVAKDCWCGVRRFADVDVNRLPVGFSGSCRFLLAELAGEGTTHFDVLVYSIAAGSTLVYTVTNCRSDVAAATYAAVVECCAAQGIAESIALSQLGQVEVLYVGFNETSVPDTVTFPAVVRQDNSSTGTYDFGIPVWVWPLYVMI